MKKVYLISPQLVKDKIQPYLFKYFFNNDLFRFYKHSADLDYAKDGIKKVGLFFTKTNIIMPFMFPHPEHELAHIVEMKNKARWTRIDLGMTYELKKIRKNVFACASREIRARAIEQRLLDISGHRKYFPVFQNKTWHDLAEKTIPFGRFRSMKDVIEWSNDIHCKAYNAWSFDKIKYEWDIRMNYYKEVMF